MPSIPRASFVLALVAAHAQSQWFATMGDYQRDRP
jgi:hypothetical protein